MMTVSSIANVRTLAFLILASMNAATLLLLYQPRAFVPREQPDLPAQIPEPQSQEIEPPPIVAPLLPKLENRPQPTVVKDEVLLDSSQRKEAFDGIFADNFWGDSESVSGYGSTLGYTAGVRKLIDYAIRQFEIESFFDAPSGDCNWQPHLETFPTLKYTGADIVGSVVLANGRKYRNFDNMRFMNLDLVRDKLPQADAYLVRDAVQHLPLEDGLQIYRNVELSGAKYLITNFHVDPSGQPTANQQIAPGQYFGVNVMSPPYNFAPPLFYIADQPADHYETVVKMTGVWELPVVGTGKGEAFPVDLSKARDIIFLNKEAET